ncbi:mannose-1-phosphate guanylyltransferase/mannose-6-phosphate isomerase [Caulobacter sp. B11]|uniref:mannose-1-phosphate guanylyltransferase/mannose-6-phosphate isomerase n=1 Tax=Caulobacter sp. B11 TaxID=2048899 RepID=UPI000C12DBFD|nr:mannose-1-phosphate guanylyltransferase/mannose-6-phosphate isomerase [Caulobacter sp. B11]PHY13613.1 mannose-1-phosphate guanylyltransferase/mannose-6-phosphate isomerase [Caulobacter sp. B11]
MSAIYPVILCGGAGTRLWPASRPDRPKQFLKLLGGHSSFQETLLRVRDLAEGHETLVVTGAGMADFVRRQAAEIDVPVIVLIEPEARDSAPAIAAAAAYVQGRDPQGVALMLAADHHVGEPDLFRAAARVAATAAEQGLIVTFGVRPTGPATGFGYIRPGAAVGAVFRVAAFVEKPDLDTARRYVEEGYLWNSGNFAFLASTLMAEFERFEPSIAEGARAALAEAVVTPGEIRLDAAGFSRAAKISLDYAVMERTDKAVVVPATFSWSDLGAWDAIWDASVRDGDDNALQGDVVLLDSNNVLIHSTGPFVGAIGVSDLVIVAEPDAVLVCRRDNAQAVKTLVDGLKARGSDLVKRHVRSLSGGVERQILTTSDAATVALWRLEAGAHATLPAGTVQLLQGQVSGAGLSLATGDQSQLAAETQITAVVAATVLITTWL